MTALAVPVPERVLPSLEPLRAPLEDLAEFTGNPQRHDLDVIAEGLRVFGQVLPLVVNRGTITGRGPELIGGHGRLEVMRRHGWERPAVAWHDLSDLDARKLAAMLNQQGRPDAEALALFLGPNIAAGDLEGSGEDAATLAAALDHRDDELSRLLEEQGQDDDEDTTAAPPAPEPPAVRADPGPVTAPGDAWRLGPLLLEVPAEATDRDRRDADALAKLHQQRTRWVPVRDEGPHDFLAPAED